MDLERRIVKCRSINYNWCFVVLPLDLKFTYHYINGMSFWYNEEKKLLIDSFYIIRKVHSLDHFVEQVKQNTDLYIKVSTRITNTLGTIVLELFNNWYEQTDIY